MPVDVIGARRALQAAVVDLVLRVAVEYHGGPAVPGGVIEFYVDELGSDTGVPVAEFWVRYEHAVDQLIRSVDEVDGTLW